MSKELMTEDYERILKTFRDIKNTSDLCSENLSRLTNGFSLITDISERISDNYSFQLVGDAQTAILQTSFDADNIGCFDTTWFNLYQEEETETTSKPQKVFEDFIQHAQKYVKDLERMKKMVNTSLQMIDTTLSMTKEIEALATDGKKYLKEKNKHDSKNHHNSDIHSRETNSGD